MNNWCICWFFTHILLGILIFKGITARRLYKSFGVKGLNYQNSCILDDGGRGEEKFAQYSVITAPNTLDGRGITKLLTVHYNFAKCVVWEIQSVTHYDLFKYSQMNSVKTSLLL
jgi:hypothetical protein